MKQICFLRGVGRIVLYLSSVTILFLGITISRQEAFANSASMQQLDNPKSLCSADLEKEIKEIIERPEFERSRWGILIETLQTEQTIYSFNDRYYFIPASNVKLLTTAAALRQLGSEFRIRTSVYGRGTLPNLTTLRVIGRGDPSLTTVQLQELAQQLKRLGVRHISQLIVEDSYFQEPRINSSWEWSDLLTEYAVSVNSLIFNENAVTLTIKPGNISESVQLNWSDSIAQQQYQVNNQAITASSGTPYSLKINGVLGKPIVEIKGKLSIDSQPDIWNLAIINPDHYFLESFRYLLASEGIKVSQGVISNNSLRSLQGTELASIESPPLTFLLKKTNQESNNLFAEVLLRILGRESTYLTGVEAIKKSLTELGVDPSSYQLKDGSGLSRQNLVSPQALVQTLRLMSQIPEGDIYRDSLAVAGVSGTLKGRFLNTFVQGNLQAKTGTLTGVVALSGYLNIPNYQPLVFSIIVNQSEQSAANLRGAIDKIILLLSLLNSC